MTTRRRGFTLVELLVVIAVIGLLVALLMPAVQMAREAGRRATCISNLRQFGFAIAQFEQQEKRLPGAFEAVQGNPGPNLVPITWAVRILPYVEQEDLYEEYRKQLPTNLYRELFLCPSDDKEHQGAANSYVANHGVAGGCLNDKPANGPFLNLIAHPRQKFKVSDFVDGADTTLLLSENVQAVNYDFIGWNGIDPAGNLDWALINAGNDVKWSPVFVWYPVLPPPQPWMQINTEFKVDISALTPDEKQERARPSSYHPEGVVVTFGGGRTQFLREGIDYIVYQQLMTPDSNRSDMPDKTYILNSPDYE